MTVAILLASATVLLCVVLNQISHKAGVPMLLAFIVLGMLFGSEGLLGIPFDNYTLAEQVCSVALIFIMFYGGFGTNWEEARPVAVQAGLLATLGVALTALFVGLFCHFALGMALVESFLLGAVISSTDAASVFSILRSKKLGLKHHTDSMLEVESGSNDPASYMLTVIMLAVVGGGITGGAVVGMVAAQLIFGVVVGILVALGAAFVMNRLRFATAGFDMAFIIGVALLSYALAAVLGGNGYLSAYLCGILLGNKRLPNKTPLVHFFDGLTGLMQMLIFFLLGLLATPTKILPVLLPALGVMVFLTLVARPAATFALLSPFRCSLRQQLLVAFAGLRGAASIVFAIMATVGAPALEYDLFHIVFCIVLLSIGVQGTLLPPAARALNMSDKSIDVMKTFSDYTEEGDLQFVMVRLLAWHPWTGRAIRALTLPPESLIVLLVRDGEPLVPDGKTVLRTGDTVVYTAHQYTGSGVTLHEQEIGPTSKWVGRPIRDFSPRTGELVIMIRRGEKTIVPKGGTMLRAGDVLVINRSELPQPIPAKEH